MEDYLIREIDRIGELLVKVARRLGLFLDDVPQYSVADIKAEMEKVQLDLNIDEILAKDAAVLYLVENEHMTEKGLEAFADIIFHSDCDDTKKSVILKDATQYLDHKGYYSFRLHSLAASNLDQ